MAIDSSRAALVLNEYRFVQSPSAATGGAIKALYDNAPSIEINTALDAAGAQAFADDLSALTTKAVRTFTLEIDKALHPDQFIDGMNRYLMSSERHVSIGPNVYTIVAAEIDYEADVTRLTVRGS
jgi:hypothetical protein